MVVSEAHRLERCAFFQLAKEELDVATWLVERTPRQSAYLVQQAAEKLARAILTDADIESCTGCLVGPQWVEIHAPDSVPAGVGRLAPKGHVCDAGV